MVTMAEHQDREHASMIDRAYRWMHRHFPHIVDCRPIDAEAVLQAGGFRVEKTERMAMWTLPVVAAVALPVKGEGR